MKKKLLSLVLAGAMVASTSVSAFAEDVEVQPTTPSRTEVDIQGNVESSKGEVLPSTVTVTVPTSASFTVKKDGSLESATITITNKGDSPVSVIASSFKDTTGVQDINLVKEGEISPTDRKKVFLKLTGGDEDIILTSKDGGKMYKGSDPTQEINANNDFKIKTINARGQLDLKLKGQGTAYNESNSNGEAAVSDSFKLVLKIKQESKPASNPDTNVPV